MNYLAIGHSSSENYINLYRFALTGIQGLGLIIIWTTLALPFFSISPPPELFPVLGPLERYMTPTLDAALLNSSRAGSDLGRTSDWLRS